MKILMRVAIFLVMAPTSLYGQTQTPEGEATQFAQVNFDRPRDPQADYMNFVPDEVLVKFKDEVNIESGGRLKSLGIGSIDRIMNKYGITELQRVFPNAVKHRNKRIVRDPQGRDMVIPDLDNIFKLKVSLDRSSTGNMPQVFQVIEELKALPEVEYAEPNYLLRIGDFEPAGPVLTQEDIINDPDIGTEEGTTTGLVPNDPLYSQQWGIPACKIDEVWNTHTGDTTSIIAILDTGVDWLHPDLAPNIWQNPGEIPGNGFDDDANGKVDDIRGWDFINNDNNPADDNSHGTHCAGIAAAVGNNGIGIAGVNWNARIMPIKVFQSSGFGDAATIASGINYAANSGASVLNMSFGSYAESLTLKNALANAYATAVLVAAAGNDETPIGPCIMCGPMFPAAYSFVLGVEANKQVVSSCDNEPTIRACFSNYDQDGPVFSQYAELHNYELKAPGVEILSCIPGGNYRLYSGTSMAAPIVAASISLYSEIKPSDSKEIIFGNTIHSIVDHLDLYGAINIIPEPSLSVINYELFDTINGDGDGRADAGEIIELSILVRNTWGQANNVMAGVKFAEFEDQTLASIIIAESSVGALSAYASNFTSIPLKIQINPSVVNNRDICFQAYTFNTASADTSFQSITIKVEYGEELAGMISDTITLTSDKLWLINGSFKLTPTGVMIIRPGTHLIVSTKIVNDGTIIANGTPDSLIYITVPRIGNGIFMGSYLDIKITGDGLFSPSFTSLGGYLFHARINISTYSGLEISDFTITDCIFEHMITKFFITGSNLLINRCNFFDIQALNNPSYLFFSHCEPCIIISNCNFSRTCNLNPPTLNNIPTLINCNFLGEYDKSFMYGVLSEYYSYSPSNYWGTTNHEKISRKIFDFYEDANLSAIVYEPVLEMPSDSAHACVWKILVDEEDLQNSLTEPIGVGEHKFEVVFSKPMDTSYIPQLSFGVRYPFTQQVVNNLGQWDSTYRIWTAYKNIQLNTGDGINRLRVSNAKDTDAWEIPIEDVRFEFVINAAGSASAGFQATPGLGKIELEWNEADLADGLGYNMYRKTRINDSTLSQPILINLQLITDTLFTDFNVIPGEEYYYYYKILRTDLSETDSSKIVAAIPLTASIGDANGDLTVNVLDITTIVAYLLNNNPQPFIYDAADVNSDESINVLDIVGLVNLVMGNSKAGTSIQEMAYLYIENDTVFADIPVALGGIQVEFGGITMADIIVLNVLKGFESGYCIIDGKLRLLYYSMTGNTIPAGKRIPLLKLGKKAWLDAIILADTRGNAVPAEYKKPYEQIITDDIVLLGQNYPNPFTGETIIPVIVYQPVSQIIVQVVNMYGQIVAVKEIQSPKVGENLIRFNSIKYKGIYTYTLEVLVEGQIVKNQSKKLIKQ